MTEISGIIVRIQESRNAAALLMVITEEYAQLKFFAPHAKSSKKRFGRLDLFDRGHFGYKENAHGLLLLEQFTSISSYPQIRTSLEKIICASLICEILCKICPEADPHSPEYYHILKQLLDALEQGDSLNTLLKATHESLLYILQASGDQQAERYQVPSSKNIRSLISITEQHLNCRIESAQEIQNLIKKVTIAS